MDLTDRTASGREPGSTSRPNPQVKPIRRRNRMINSCLECRKRKLKCSKTSPTCGNCVKGSRDCLYIGPRLDEASQMRLAEIKEKQGTLERQLERDVAKSTVSKSCLQQRILADEVEDDPDDYDLEANPLVALDLTYEDDADGGSDDMIDLGVQIGKMRITERIGGLSRPRISEEIMAGISQRTMGHSPQSQSHGPQMPTFEDNIDSMSDGSLPDYLKPSENHIVPSSGIFFGQVGELPDILQFLPHQGAADRLMRQYFGAVHPVAPCSHRASMEGTYAAFWEDIHAGFEPRPSTQAIIFATMFSGIVSMKEDVIFHELGGFPKANWVASLKIGTETALSKANFLRTTNLETLQAFIIYMIPLCRAEVSRAHSVLLGAAVRMAECMGLHRDGDTYGLTPLDTHVRRLVWHQLCFLDVRTCEAQGPKPVIRREDYDTKLPINCDEAELSTADAPQPESSDTWTTNTLPLIRFEINEMMRAVWVDRRRLETRRTTLTVVLTKIENFRRRMSEKYDHMLDVSLPLQRYARCVMYLLTYRLHIMVLHPYYANASSPMPPRLAHLLITSGIMVIELSMQLETNPVFQDWAWYLGAYFQYQIALLLATEVYFRPQSREADRIWSCLDYVFNLDRKMPTEAKAAQLLADISSRTAMYRRRRKMRGPCTTARAAVANNAVAGTGANSASAGHPAAHPVRHPLPTQFIHHQQQEQQQQHMGARMGAMSAGDTGNVGPKSDQNYMPSSHNCAALQAGPPQPQMVFAGVSDGQVLWTLPSNTGSPQSSDASSLAATNSSTMTQAAVAGATVVVAPGTVPASGGNATAAGGGSGPGPGPAPEASAGQGNIMDGIDWDTMYALFPNDTQTGELSIQGYHDPNFGVVNWAR